MNPEYKGRYCNRSMPYSCLYLNNSGSRWVRQDMRVCIMLDGKVPIIRLMTCLEAFGNYALIVYRYKGKQYKALADRICQYHSIPVITHNRGVV